MQKIYALCFQELIKSVVISTSFMGDRNYEIYLIYYYALYGIQPFYSFLVPPAQEVKSGRIVMRVMNGVSGVTKAPI